MQLIMIRADGWMESHHSEISLLCLPLCLFGHFFITVCNFFWSRIFLVYFCSSKNQTVKPIVQTGPRPSFRHGACVVRAVRIVEHPCEKVLPLRD